MRSPHFTGRAVQPAARKEVREVGTLNLYAVRAEGFASVRAFLDDFWSSALTRLQRLARERR